MDQLKTFNLVMHLDEIDELIGVFSKFKYIFLQFAYFWVLQVCNFMNEILMSH